MMKQAKILVILCSVILSVSHAAENESTKSTPATVKLSAVSGLKVSLPKERLTTKRDVKITELSNVINGENYAASPPDYYRTSALTSSSQRNPTAASSTATTDSYADSETAGFVSKPVTFPDSYSRNKYLSGKVMPEGRLGDGWQALKNAAIAKLDGHALHERISVGHHHHDSSLGDAGYEYDRHAPNTGNQYLPAGYASAHGSGYNYNGGGGHTGGTYGEEPHYAEGIPFDFYGGSNKGHYTGNGGEYSYTTYNDPYNEPISHKGPNIDWTHKALLAKSFLIPLASAAVLGITAALVSNPLLLQLGTVSGAAYAPTLLGRRRRDLSLKENNAEKQESSQALAYRAHNPTTHKQ